MISKLFFLSSTVLLLCIISIPTKAQFYNDGAVFTLQKESEIYVDDTYIQQTGEIENQGTIELIANWINNTGGQIFKANLGGTVKLSGTDQVLGGSSITAFETLLLRGNGIKKLENDQKVTLLLDLGERELFTGDYVLQLINSSPNSLSRITGYISSTKKGGFRRNTSLSQDYLFPLGFKNESNRIFYRPLVVKPTTSDQCYTAAILPNAFTIDHIGTANTSAFRRINTDYYYKLNRNVGTTPVTLKVWYNSKTDGVYDRLLNWEKAAYKLQPLMTTEEFDGISADFLDRMLKNQQWNNFNDEYYLMAESGPQAPIAEIPNAISANSDGKNDSWQIPLIEGFPNNQVVVYNRWGTEVYRKANYCNCDPWRADNVHAGVYFYKITLSSNGSDVEVKKGSLTIIK